MVTHNLLLNLRSFRRFKSNFIINLIGLTSGLAASILIYLWVNDELMFDKFHSHNERLFQVMEHNHQEGIIQTTTNTADFLSSALVAEMPEIEYAAATTPDGFFPSFTLRALKHAVKANGKFAEKDFLKIFSFDLVQGETCCVLNDKSGIAISESLARKLFASTENCVGKTISWQVMYIKKEAIVSGVFKDVPANSSQQFDFVMPFDAFLELMEIKIPTVNWDNNGPFTTYLLTKQNADIGSFQSKIKNLLQTKSKNVQRRQLFLKPYSANYLHGDYKNGKEAGGRIEYVLLFSVVGMMILLIAVINFINLSTAKTATKAKETGIKKAIGASRKTLIIQFLTEALVITGLSTLLALTIVTLLLPKFNEMTGKHIELIIDTKTVLVLCALTAVTTIFAGAYPSLYLSAFSPAKILKGLPTSSAVALSGRKTLVVFQFCLSTIFIVAVLVVYKQIDFILNKNIGFEKDNIVSFDVEGKVAENVETFLTELKKVNGVLEASSSLGSMISQGGGIPGTLKWNDKTVTIQVGLVNYGLLELFGFKMKEGRMFSKDHPSDVNAVIYNEAALKAIGVENAVGIKIDNSEVIGVVEDFHFQTLHEVVKPFAFRLGLQPEDAMTITVKIKSGTDQQTIENLQVFYNHYNPGFVFTYNFLDQIYQARYVSEKRIGTLSKYAASIAVIISCLGLFALAAFTTERRTKEISIRKVLGSTEAGILLLLTKDFTKVVLIAVVIALPLSYYLSTYWLGTFAYKIDLKLWYFIATPMFMILIAIVTIAGQTIRAARSNPVNGLKAE